MGKGFRLTVMAVAAGSVLVLAVPAVMAAAAEPFAAPTAAPAPSALAERGREPFAASCGFCHGRDATGGSTGPDLTHSELVNADKDGNLIGELLRSGRADKGMPAFAQFQGEELKALVAYVHYQQQVADSAFGQRRSVAPADLATGDAGKGKSYFDKQCVSCHSTSGDLAGIGQRLSGLTLLRRLLYPGSESRTATRRPPSVAVTTAAGEHFTGTLAARDEFTLAMLDTGGVYHSWPLAKLEFKIDDPLEAHVQQLARYTDADLHNVYLYLQGLK